jgi:hypothetical protein
MTLPRITPVTWLVVLGTLAAAGVAVAVVGLATSHAGDDSARAAYLAELGLAVVVAILIASLADGRRRALTAARVEADALSRELGKRGEHAAALAASERLVAELVRAGADRDAEQLAIQVARTRQASP